MTCGEEKGVDRAEARGEFCSFENCKFPGPGDGLSERPCWIPK